MVVEKEASVTWGRTRARVRVPGNPSRRSGTRTRAFEPHQPNTRLGDVGRDVSNPRPRRPGRVSQTATAALLRAEPRPRARPQRASVVLAKPRGRGEREEFGILMSRDDKKRSLQTPFHRLAAPALRRLLPRVRSRRRRVRHASPRRLVALTSSPHFWPAWRAAVEVDEFPVVLRHTPAAPLLHPATAAAPSAPDAASSAFCASFAAFFAAMRRRLCRGVDGCVRSGFESSDAHAIDRYAYPDKRRRASDD